uniref:Secreted protein n=1 Tax=Kalanchoe fedtschenkoi TaxID=63787 RepID=A0A7N0VDM1_KALFE
MCRKCCNWLSVIVIVISDMHLSLHSSLVMQEKKSTKATHKRELVPIPLIKIMAWQTIDLIAFPMFECKKFLGPYQRVPGGFTTNLICLCIDRFS